MEKQTLIYNDEIIEHKIDLFNRIEHILDTKFNEVPIDAGVWLLFKEYFDMHGLRISRAYNSNDKNIYILLSDSRISTDVDIDDEFKTAIQTEKQLEDFLYRLESDYGIDNVVMRIHPSDEQYKIGELFVIKKILYTLYNYPWMVSDKYVKPADDILRCFKPIYNTGRILRVCIFSFITNVFIKKLFEGYEPTTISNPEGVSTNVRIDHLTDDYKCTFECLHNEYFDPLNYLYSLLLHIQAHRQFYIFRSIVESIDIVNYFGCYIVDNEPLRLTVSNCYFGYDVCHALSNPYARTGEIKLYEPHFGLKITIDVETDDYNVPNAYYVKCHMNEEQIRVCVNRIFRDQLLTACITLQMLTNKYAEYLI